MRKRPLLGVLVCWLVWSGGVRGAELGDLNGDGTVNSADAVKLQNYLAGNIGTLHWAETDSIVGDLMYVPAGTFGQGSPSDEPCRDSDETQFTHTLTRNLAVMATEVTRQMWADLKAVQPTLPVDPTDTNYGAGMTNPVQKITWYEAVLCANLLSVQRGLTRCYYIDAGFTTPVDATNYTTGPFYCDFEAGGFRLLSEGEWEYCCRAGTGTPFWIAEPNYSSDNCESGTSGLLPSLETAAVFAANSLASTATVATKPPNPWGLHDIHGNVSEWCWDCMGTYPVGSSTNYAGPASGSSRVKRGGGWNTGANACRSAMRDYSPAGYRSFGAGFRLARSL